MPDPKVKKPKKNVIPTFSFFQGVEGSYSILQPPPQNKEEPTQDQNPIPKKINPSSPK